MLPLTHRPADDVDASQAPPIAPAAAFMLLVAAGAVTGAGHWWAPAAWLGMGLLAVALRTAWPARLLAAGLVAHGLAMLVAGHPWVLEGAAVYLPGGMDTARRAIGPMALAWVTPLALSLFVGARLAGRFHLPVWAWLPAAWALGEAGFAALTGLDFTAWLYTQYQSAPVLRAVGYLGWWPSLFGAVAVSALVAEALATRSRRSGAIAALGLAAAMLLPPLQADGPAAFAGVGAVHMAGDRQLPRAAPAGLDLLVWPEAADGQRPSLVEGKPTGAYIEPPFRALGLHHLYGLHCTADETPSNAMLAIGPEGEVLGVRAKTRLFPLTERPLWGYEPVGAARFKAGTAPPVLDVAGRRVGVLLCLEGSDRGLALAARQAGATLLAVAAGEKVGASAALAEEQLLATSVLRAVETGLPVVRASKYGHAALIDRDGRILAKSPLGTDGVLSLQGDTARPALPDPPSSAPPGGLAVLYAKATPAMLPQVPATLGARYALEDFRVPASPAQTVILSGDSQPPMYAGQPPDVVARAIASFNPRLVVLDTCWGATSPLLDALAEAGVDATVVAAPFRIPAAGFVYQPDFFTEPDAGRRALAVRLAPSFPLLRWRLDGAALKRLHAEVAAMSPAEQHRRTKRLRPRLLRMQLPGRPAPDGRVLVLAASRPKPR